MCASKYSTAGGLVPEAENPGVAPRLVLGLHARSMPRPITSCEQAGAGSERAILVCCMGRRAHEDGLHARPPGEPFFLVR